MASRTTLVTAGGAMVLGTLIGAGAQPAGAANTVNATFRVPAKPVTNPCAPTDVVNLSGDIHVVMTSTSSKAGGYTVTSHLNSHLSGLSITTGTRYVSDETQEQTWHGEPPYPVIHKQTHTWTIVSQSGTDDYLLHMTMHQTVSPGGVPTATADNFRLECKG
ncbi:MAG TPA: hypothetical protein VEZ46_15520 [Mycobacteriales bacterium]|nr:hypothetical protein [Mycobacteriales bacterium]